MGPEDPPAASGYEVAQAVEFIRALHVHLRKMTRGLAWLERHGVLAGRIAGMCSCKLPLCAATSRNLKFLSTGYSGVT